MYFLRLSLLTFLTLICLSTTRLVSITILCDCFMLQRHSDT